MLNLFKTSLLGLLSVYLLTFSSVALANNFKVEVGPSIMDLELKPGDVVQEEITLFNFGEKDLNLYLNKADFFYNDNDIITFIDDESDLTEEELKKYERFSAKSWLKVEEQIFLKAGEKIKLPVEITVPANALPGGRYSSVFFTSEKPEIESKGAAIGINSEIGVLIAITLPGDTKGGVFAGKVKAGQLSTVKDRQVFKPKFFFYDWWTFENGSFDFMIKYLNNNGAHVSPKTIFVVERVFPKKTIDVFEGPERRVFPFMSKEIYGTLDKEGLIGLYKVSVDASDRFGTKSFTYSYFVGLPPLALLIFLVLCLIFFKIYLQRRDKKLAERIKAAFEGSAKPVLKKKGVKRK